MDPREWLFDKRVVRRNLDKGVLSLKAYKEYLKSLDNLNKEFELVELEPKGESDDEAAGDDESADAEE